MEYSWYFEDHGRAQGPISTRDLIAKVQKGELTLVDLVFKEGEPGWQPIEKFKEITSQITVNPVNASAGPTSREAEWIVLRVIEVDGREKYEQIGPYTVEQVLELIDAGRVKFNDFVWKTGFQNWVPLGKLDKFDKPLASSVVVDESLYIKPNLLRETNRGVERPDEKKSVPVKAYTPVQKAPELKPEAPPEGASGPDLAQPAWAADLQKKMPQAEAKPVAKPVMKAEPQPEMSRTDVLVPEPVKVPPAKVDAKSEAKPEPKTESPPKPNKFAKEIFDFGNSITNLLSPLKGPKRAPTGPLPGEEKRESTKVETTRAEKTKSQIFKNESPKAEPTKGEMPKPVESAKNVARVQGTQIGTNPLRYQAVDLGERTHIQPSVKETPKESTKTGAAVVPPIRKEFTSTSSQVTSSQAAPSNPFGAEPPPERFPVRKPQRTEETSTHIPPVVVTKVVKREARAETATPMPDDVMPAAERDPVAHDKMQGRWNRVGTIAAAILVLGCVGILGLWAKKHASHGESATDIAFEKHQAPTPSLSQFENNTPPPEPAAEPQPTVETAPPPQPEVAAKNLPAPEMDVPEPTKNAPAAAEPAPAKTAQAPQVDEDRAAEDVTQMSVKQKSFFHQQERQFIFYTSQKGLNLANLLDAAVKKKNKTPASWKKFQVVWQGQVKSLNQKISKEIGSSKVHTSLFKNLKTAGLNLDKRGKDISSQMLAGRAPTKEPSVSDIIADFKKINAKAKSLDQ